MSLFTLLNRIKPYLLSNSSIWLLKREASTMVPEVDSTAIIRQISSSQELIDILAVESEQQFSVYEKLLNKGELCFYAYINQGYVARAWASISDIKLSYLKAWNTILPSNSAYIYGLFTVSSERGKHIAQKLIATICNRLFEKDIYTMVLPTKPQSLKVFYRCGFVPIKSITITYFCFIPFVVVKKLSEKMCYDR